MSRSFVNLGKCQSDPELSCSNNRPPVRPRFHHLNTNDRIREGSGRPPTFSMLGKIRKDRKSVFKELGLDEDDSTSACTYYSSEREFGEITGLVSPKTPRDSTRTFESARYQDDNRSDDGKSSGEGRDGRGNYNIRSEPGSLQSSPTSPSSQNRPWYSKLSPRRPRVKTISSAPPPSMTSFSRLATIAVLIAVVIPGFNYFNGRGEEASLNGIADAGVINRAKTGPVLDPRADSPTDVCKRWAHQVAQLNGTLYIYGGQAITSADQKSNAWNNYFLTLDLSESWDVSSPSVKGLPQPVGPPAVSLGYLWNDYNNLYLYGGQFSDTPFVEPESMSLWKYNIPSKTWIEYQSPVTSQGKYSDGGDVPVQRAAEGAGLSVPELGLSWYFGGHLDMHTTQGWSNQIARHYLKSLLEFTHPGYTNELVDSLGGKSGAGDGGVFRNITEGGLQSHPEFAERADSVLVYVPGWGEMGILIGLGGGSWDEFADSFETLDVYDIKTSEWYHQKTTGTAPSNRVNACAVIASAPDASSFQIYLFGGQNLASEEQTQYSDMYILSIPSFTWIKVDQEGGARPAGRAGHTCSLRDGQMIIVGGYTGRDTGCDSPGIYVFNATSLRWTSEYKALDHEPDFHPENSVLGGSYGYQVPAPVASVIGGGPDGGATATTPASGPATGGPFATGKPPVFTVTAPGGGGTATVTQWGPGATTTGGVKPGPAGSNTHTDDNRRAGLIAAGVIAGLAGLAAIYLGYCAWLYRRQVRAYKTHLAVANRYSAPGTGSTSGFAAFFGRKGSKESRKSGAGIMAGRAAAAGAAAGVMSEKGKNRTSHQVNLRDPSPSGRSSLDQHWGIGTTGDGMGFDDMDINMPPTEPKLLFDDDRPSPESGYHSGGSHPQGYLGAGSTGFHSRPSVAWMHDNSGNSGGTHGTGTTPGGQSSSAGTRYEGAGGVVHSKRGGSPHSSGGSISSTEQLLDGQEPSFFSVVLGPRRALRVVNGLEGEASSIERRESF